MVPPYSKSQDTVFHGSMEPNGSLSEHQRSKYQSCQWHTSTEGAGGTFFKPFRFSQPGLFVPLPNENVFAFKKKFKISINITEKYLFKKNSQPSINLFSLWRLHFRHSLLYCFYVVLVSGGRFSVKAAVRKSWKRRQSQMVSGKGTLMKPIKEINIQGLH